jgi:fructose-1-phosphate kinase PfkB-like protein
MRGKGALRACGVEHWRVVPPKAERQSTVGSGDLMVAGLPAPER